MLRGLKVQVSYQIQQFNCETGISSLGFTSPQPLPSRWHEQSIMKPIMGGVHLLILTVVWFVTPVFGVHTHLLSDCVTPLLLLTPSLVSCFWEGAPNGFSWTAGLLIGFIQVGMFLSPRTVNSGRVWWCRLCSLRSYGANVFLHL